MNPQVSSATANYTVPSAPALPELKHASPYQASTVNAYRLAGWTDVFPIVGKVADRGKLVKSPPPSGFTGYSAQRADVEQHKAWMQEIKPSKGGLANIGLHMNGVIGLDVDQYGKKAGVQVLLGLELDLGPLPPTWRNSARGADPKAGGHLFFRITPEQAQLKWPGTGGAAIDVIQAGHRYAVVWPSQNPDADGAVYRWYLPPERGVDEGALQMVAKDFEIPRVDELPFMPEAWVQYFTGGAERFDLTAAEMSEDELGDWLGDRPDAASEPCSEMQVRLKYALDHLASGHTALNDALFSLVKMGFEGHRGVGTALQSLYGAWKAEVTEGGSHGMRSASQFHGEWMRSLNGAVAKVVGTDGEPDPACICGKTIGWLDKLSERGGVDLSGRAHMREQSDTGNADRIFDYFGDTTLHAYKVWLNYDGVRWVPSPEDDRAPLRIKARATLALAKEHESLLYDDSPGEGEKPKLSRRAEFLKWLKSQSSARASANMITMLDTKPEMMARMEDFDRSRAVLNCPNGTLEFLRNDDPSVKLRPQAASDLLTRCIATAYDAEATAPKWEKFLEASHPDPEMRAFLQRIMGLTLTGWLGKHDIFFHVGPGGAGKGTFTKVLGRIMGPYHHAANRAMFLYSPDKSPADIYDLANVPGMRFLEISETRENERLNEDLIKALSSGDQMSVRGIYGKPFQMNPHAKLHMFTNNMPRLEDFTGGMERRLNVIRWDQKVIKSAMVDELHEDILSTEAAGVLNWLVQGAVEWMRIGLAQPVGVVVDSKAAMTEGNPFQAFVDEWLVQDPEQTVTPQDLYDVYTGWCKAEGIKPTSRAWLSKRLLSMGVCTTAPGTAVRRLQGIRLKTLAEHGPLSQSELYSNFAGIVGLDR